MHRTWWNKTLLPELFRYPISEAREKFCQGLVRKSEFLFWPVGLGLTDSPAGRHTAGVAAGDASQAAGGTGDPGLAAAVGGAELAGAAQSVGRVCAAGCQHRHTARRRGL